MWRSGKDPENGTAAEDTLRQSRFVQYRESDEYRRAVRSDPQASVNGVRQILAEQDTVLTEEETFLRELCGKCAGFALGYAKEIREFAETLPTGFFSHGDGRMDLLRFSLSVERARPHELALREAIVQVTEIERNLSELRLPAKEAEVVCLMMEQTEEVKTLIDALSGNADRKERFYKRIRAFEGLLFPFVRQTLPDFLIRSGDLCDLSGNGEKLRTQSLRTLCGEVCHAAEEFARGCAKI